MPMGRRRTGRRRPMTPGSSRPVEKRTATVAGMPAGVLDRKALRIERQPRHLTEAMPAKPSAQMPRIAVSADGRVFGAGEAGGSVRSGNGWLIRAMATDTEVAGV